MLASKKTRRGAIGAVVLAGVLAVSGYALTDTLTTPTTSHAGDGTNAVENLTASAVHYTLNATPSDVDAVTFHLDHNVAAGGAVWVQPDGTNWYSCDITDLDDPTCATTSPQLTAAAVTQVRVVAAD